MNSAAPDGTAGLLLDLVGAVYQGPLDAEPWSVFAERLRVAMAARNVAVTLHHPDGVTLDTYVMAAEPGDRTDWDAVERMYRERYMADDPRRLDRMAPGDILLIDPGSGMPGFGEYILSLGIGQSLRTRFDEPGGMCCWIDIVRPREGAAPFGEAELALLRSLHPHLVRALELHARHRRLELEKAVYEDTIDHLLLGSVLLDGALRIVHRNRAAVTIMASHPGIRVVRDRLWLAEPGSRRLLDAALARALEDATDDAAERRGELVRVDTPEGQPLGLLVQAVAQGRYCRGAHAPSVVVFIADLGRSLDALHPAREASQALVGRLFGLTPQEARLALLLADGCTLAQAAGHIGVAETAARSYSKRIYAKMGIKSQSDIVRLVYRSLALLR